MDTAKLGLQLHLQGSAKAAPPRERAVSPQHIPHTQQPPQHRCEHKHNHTPQGPESKQSPPLNASPQESNHHFDTAAKTQ